MKFIPQETPSFWSDTSIFVKIVFLLLLGIVIFLIVRLCRRPKDTTKQHIKQPIQLQKTNMSLSLIHIGIHAYKCDPMPIAQTIFGAFEASQYPQFVHIHIYRYSCMHMRVHTFIHQYQYRYTNTEGYDDASIMCGDFYTLTTSKVSTWAVPATRLMEIAFRAQSF